MAIKLCRRQFIQSMTALSAAALSPLTIATGHQRNDIDLDQLILSAASDQQNNHYMVAFDGDKQWLKTAIDHRGHASTINHLYQQLIFFSRRPGQELIIYDIHQQKKQVIGSANNRHFFGHGCFSDDQKMLYCSENAFDQSLTSSHGVIGIYDATDDYRRVGEIDCQGIGPHQIALMPDSKTLAVAIGGIQTHPSRPREKLNLRSMKSALIFIDIASSTVIYNIACPEPQLSLRHLAISKNGSVIIAGQYQGDRSDNITLLYQYRDNKLQPMAVPNQQWLGFNQYIASVALNHHSLAVTTSPRANSVELWDLANQQLIGKYTVKDCAGVVWSDPLNGFILSNGAGQLLLMSVINKQPTIRLLQHDSSLRWDNHLSA
jgi:hypothetical protein